MRLICPNCDAQYEVAPDAIPAEGRDVQCSNCGHAWFQAALQTAEMATTELYHEPEPIARPASVIRQTPPTGGSHPASEALPRRKLDEDLMAVLREEAEREIAARRAEQRIEVQDDLGLPEPEPVRKSAAPKEPEEELSVTERRIAVMQGKPVPRVKAAVRRDMFPDIEEINSTLRPNADAMAAGDEDLEADASSRAGFRSGFVLALVVAGVAAASYVMAPQLGDQIPTIKAPLDRYVALVDDLRGGIDGLFRDATEFLKGMTSAKG